MKTIQIIDTKDNVIREFKGILNDDILRNYPIGYSVKEK